MGGPRTADKPLGFTDVPVGRTLLGLAPDHQVRLLPVAFYR